MISGEKKNNNNNEKIEADKGERLRAGCAPGDAVCAMWAAAILQKPACVQQGCPSRHPQVTHLGLLYLPPAYIPEFVSCAGAAAAPSPAHPPTGPGTVMRREMYSSCGSGPEVPDPLSHCQLHFNPRKVIGSWVYF